MSVRPPANETHKQAATPVAVRREKLGGKFLTFFLGAEEYALEILKVYEIIGIMPITWVPRTPNFVRGVINLRGKVITVIDLRLKFGMPAVEHTSHTCIIVVQTQEIEIGIIVDKVSEVVNISSDEIQETPSMGTGVNTEFILGIGKMAGRVKLLLDIDKVLTAAEVFELKGTATEAELLGEDES